MEKSNLSEKEIFVGALELSTPSERLVYLKAACRDDVELRHRIEALLEAHEQASEFLKAPAPGVSSKTLLITTGMIPVTEKPGDRIGRYKLREQIGEGGCGVVYVADQEEPVRRRLALKVIKLGMDTRQVVARFEAERQALALMDHPNIARVLDAGATDTGRPYFVMELVRGIKITDYCDKNNLSTEERLKLFIQVCSAIQHAHQKGIIHRDIKPSNILVTLHDGLPVPKVIDFGIAKATSDQRLTDKTVYTAFEQFIGTPAYMSPEQAEMSGLDVDTRSDIYSLGVLLYELLTGRPPFDAATLLKAGLDQMRRIIREQEPQRPSTRLSTLEDADLTVVANHRHAEPPKLLSLIRGDLDWIVMKSLDKDRTRRYETANGFAQDILRHLDSEAVVARPPSSVYRFRKFARRNKLPLAAAGVVATALVVGLGLSVWSLTQERKARENEARMRRQAEAAEQKAQSEGNRADAQATEARKVLAKSDFLQAARFIADEKDNDALPYLIRSLKNDPTNEAAATPLAMLLASRSWCFPILRLTHGGYVYSAQFSPDGNRVVTASDDCTARVWDAQTGQPLTEPLKHRSAVYSAEFSPDGKRMVTASGDDTARVWDAQTGLPLIEPLEHEEKVNSAQFSMDGKRVATASDDKTARIWDAQTGQPLTEPLKHDRWVYSAQFSPDGKRVVTASDDRTARVWDAQTGQPLTEPLKHDRSVYSAQFSPDGKRVVTASNDHTARVWDAQTGQPLTEPLEHGLSDDWDSSVQFSADGKWLVTAYGSTARVRDAQTGQPLAGPLKHGHEVYSAEFSPDGRRVVTASDDHTARVWDAQTSQPLTRPLKHDSSVYSAQFSPDGKRVMTVSSNYTVRLWDVTPLPRSHPTWLLSLAEALSTETLNSQGAVEASKLNQADVVKQIREMLSREPEDDGWVTWGRWVLAEPFDRTISPFAKTTVPEYIEHRIEDGTVRELEEVAVLAAGNERLLQRIGVARQRLEKIEQVLSLYQKGNRLMQQGKPSEAETAYREALAIHTKYLGDANTHRFVADMLAYFGRVLRQQGKLAESEATYRQALVIRKKLLGEEHPEVAATLSSLAFVLRQQGKLAEAEATSREAEAAYRAVAEIASAHGLDRLARDLATSDDPGLRDGRIAVFLAEKAVSLAKRKDPQILDTLAAAYAESGEFEQALRVQKEAIGLIGNNNDYASRLKLYEAKTPYRKEK